ncbi:hypothetical protein CROQUDRAFT_674195 [Cronartium quercuum f. sp. fusiforme G11]|uniref:BUB1 N-terminal domain-containing protein n=1 Tax=Cronartium quercuum f. sp. fusiforme G11 TaxID=708437 RepID=A0A9P6N7F5_9BASI|nr:hypothetical protein CROQUDRAFT_674195 [Cronartium quercuum f. sp. fusiforme G11]
MEDAVQNTREAPLVVDFSTIENQKENIQPLASGRSAAQLSSLFQKGLSNSQTSTELSQATSSAVNPMALAENLRSGHQAFRKDIDRLERAERGELDELDVDGRERALELLQDPLEIYVQYVRWTIESYPSGGTTAESKLIPLLEQSTRKFVTDSRYQNDLRYLKLWIYYSHQVHREASRAIFSFLFHKKIGLDLSLLYEECSIVLCCFKDYDKAKEVLKRGIERQASPVERLVNRLEDVQQQHATAIANAPPPVEATLNPVPKSKGGPPKKPVKGKMKIFEDGAEGQSSIPGQITRWDDIGTVEKNRKQNTVEPTAWKGQKLAMKPAATAGVPVARPTKMKIFEDSPGSVSAVDTLPKASGTLSEHTGLSIDSGKDHRHCDYEVLKTNPFQYHKSWKDMNMRIL